MPKEDILFYLLDLYILFMFVKMRKISKQVELETEVGMRFKWIIPVVLIAVGVIGIFQYKSTFGIIQAIVFALMAYLYYGMKSGLSKDGIVQMGRLTPYSKAENLDVDENDCCVKFSRKKAPVALYYDYEQLNDVRMYLTKHAGVNLIKKKK